MFNILSFIFFVAGATSCKNSDSEYVASREPEIKTEISQEGYKTDILTGADQTENYFPLLKDKMVSLVVNQTSVIGNVHLVDTLLRSGIKIHNIFAPEHGFRGMEDAGATVFNSRDTATGLQVISLYGDHKKPTWSDLADADIVVFDIQDVGARFYTYISTLHYVMEACAENKKPLLVLDRPNPNGFYVDGPVLKKEFSSFVGMHPVPVVHGMTIGEYAKMINGEGWLSNGIQCDLTVIPCMNYSHKDYYEIKIPPSPNLRTMRSIYLYPSLCFFEGTNVSVGRGTDKPFEIYGSPFMPKKESPDGKFKTYSFTPKAGPGSKSPPFMNQECNGADYSVFPITLLRDTIIDHHVNLAFLFHAYDNFNDKNNFFLLNNFFNKLAGSDELMTQIKSGLRENEIYLSWQDDIAEFKLIRKKYLLYEDFE